MARADLTLAELESYQADVAEPADFDAFWAATLAQAREFPLEVRATPVSTAYLTVEVSDVSFAGFGGDRINAWLTKPRHVTGPLPAVVEFVGYSGGRELPGANLHWASAGFAHLYVDTRGQGYSGAGGVTGDPQPQLGPRAAGFMTVGIQDPAHYYYRRVFTDAVRAVEAVRQLPGVDPANVSVAGISQGGGITLAVSGLVPDLVAVMPDVPFLCHYRRAVDITDTSPYSELTDYLSVYRGAQDVVFHTLSYFDGANHAKRAKAHSLFSVGLMDKTCPPSTVYAAYHRYGGPKQIEVYEFNDHEGGGLVQRHRQLAWLQDLISARN